MNEPCAAAAPRRDKHLELIASLEAIHEVKNHVKSLLAQITNESEDDQNVAEQVTPSLEQVLNDTPDKIRLTCDQINSVVNDIRAALF
jgi:hypothetical protein